MTVSGVELVGGPMDGCRYAWPDGNDIMVVAQPVYMPALMLNVDPDAAPEVIPTVEHAYLRDRTLPWRFVYGGERQR